MAFADLTEVQLRESVWNLLDEWGRLNRTEIIVNVVENTFCFF